MIVNKIYNCPGCGHMLTAEMIAEANLKNCPGCEKISLSKYIYSGEAREVVKCTYFKPQDIGLNCIPKLGDYQDASLMREKCFSPVDCAKCSFAKRMCADNCADCPHK